MVIIEVNYWYFNTQVITGSLLG